MNAIQLAQKEVAKSAISMRRQAIATLQRGIDSETMPDDLKMSNRRIIKTHRRFIEETQRKWGV